MRNTLYDRIIDALSEMRGVSLLDRSEQQETFGRLYGWPATPETPDPCTSSLGKILVGFFRCRQPGSLFRWTRPTLDAVQARFAGVPTIGQPFHSYPKVLVYAQRRLPDLQDPMDRPHVDVVFVTAEYISADQSLLWQTTARGLVEDLPHSSRRTS